MRCLILGGLSALLLSAVTTPAVLAQSNTTNPALNNNDSDYLIKPFNLAYMAYQGFFKEQGIPSAAGLINAYNLRKIKAEDIVAKAVETNRLPSTALSDEDYIKAVDQQLQQLRWDNQD